MPFIYKLVGLGDEVYIGSTTQSLKDRLSHHKTDYKSVRSCTSRIIFDEYGLDAVRIEMLEEVAENEMLPREKFYIMNTLNVVNKIVPLRSEEEKKERVKKYIQTNREVINEKVKIYRGENKEYFINYGKKYREENKEYRKSYNNVKSDCECGGKYTHIHKSRHLKTKKHLTWLETA